LNKRFGAHPAVLSLICKIDIALPAAGGSRQHEQALASAAKFFAQRALKIKSHVLGLSLSALHSK
jgi:hypothetical protein